MSRPREWYVIFRQGEAIEVVEGATMAKDKVAQLAIEGYSAATKKCRTEYQAQEFASWWNYDHPRHF